MALGKILRTHQVLEVTGLQRSTLYRYIAKGTFPEPIRLGPQSVGWEEEAVDAWRASRQRGVDSPRGHRIRGRRLSVVGGNPAAPTGERSMRRGLPRRAVERTSPATDTDSVA